MKEFIKLENCLKLTLKIEPKSPLLIMLGRGKGEEDSNYIPLLTSESSAGTDVKYDKDREKLGKDERQGEIYLPGSSIRGVFRNSYKKFRDEKALFGTLERKNRIHIGDAYFFDEEKRKKFYETSKENIEEFFRSRSITPIESFTGKVIVPLKFEYTKESFRTEITVNNITKRELQTLFLILRDSTLGEIRMGSSKNRGFGEVEFKIEELLFEKFGNSENHIKELIDKNFFATDDKRSIKIGNSYLREALVLKKEFAKIDNDNPNRFILELFREVEDV